MYGCPSIFPVSLFCFRSFVLGSECLLTPLTDGVFEAHLTIKNHPFLQLSHESTYRVVLRLTHLSVGGMMNRTNCLLYVDNSWESIYSITYKKTICQVVFYSTTEISILGSFLSTSQPKKIGVK